MHLIILSMRNRIRMYRLMSSGEWLGWFDWDLEGERLENRREEGLRNSCMDGKMAMGTKYEDLCIVS